MTVSIIIPTYNAAPFVARALHAALRAGTQVGTAWEVIVVDDGSTDQTVTTVERIARQYPEHVQLIRCPHRGAPAARNAGVARSRGEWLQFLDADDVITDRKISHQLALSGSAQWVVGAYQHRYLDGSTEEVLPHPDLWRGLFHNFRTGHTISNLLRRTAFDSIGGWDETLASNQDPDLAFRLLRAGTPYVLDEAINSYYLHHDGPDRIIHRDAAGRLHRRVTMLGQANDYLYRHRHPYWQQHAPFFLGALLRAIRMEATHDLPAAVVHYHGYFGTAGRYNHTINFDLVPQYTRLYPYLGFRNLERLRLALAGILPPAIKRLAKQ